MPPRTTALTPEQARALGKAALANAVTLLDDVKVLLEHHKWARSYALAALAIEEYGKFRLCEEVATRPPANWSNFWSDLKTHDPKTREWSGALLDSVRPPGGGGGAVWNHARGVMTADGSKFVKAVGEGKMSGFYVDWDGPSGRPLTPANE